MDVGLVHLQQFYCVQVSYIIVLTLPCSRDYETKANPNGIVQSTGCLFASPNLRNYSWFPIKFVVDATQRTPLCN